MTAISATNDPGHTGWLRFPATFILNTGTITGLLTVPLVMGGVRLWAFAVSAAAVSGGLLCWAVLFGRGGAGAGVGKAAAVWAGIYTVFFLLSLSFSGAPAVGVFEVYRLGVVFCFFCATLAVCRNPKAVYRTGAVLACLGAALSVFGLLQYLGALPRDWWHRPEFLSSVFINHNHFAGFLEMVLPLTLGLAFAERVRPKKILFIFFSIIMGAAFCLALSRGAVVSLASGLLVFFGAVSRGGRFRRAAWLMALVVIATAGAVVAFGLEPLVQRAMSVKDLVVSGEAPARYSIWTGTVELIRHYPWFGTGPGTFQEAFGLFRPAGFGYAVHFAHNDYLQAWAECGVFALMAALGFFGAIVLRGWRIVRSSQNRLVSGVGAGCIAAYVSLAVHSMVDFNFHIPANACFFAAITALLLSLDDRKVAASRRASWLPAGVTLCVLPLSLVLGFSDYCQWQAGRLESAKAPRAALKALDKSIQVNPLNAVAYYKRADFRIRQAEVEGLEMAGYYGDAAVDFARAVVLNPMDAHYAYRLADARARMQEEDAALKALPLYEEAVRKEPRSARVFFLAGRSLLEVNLGAEETAVEEAGERYLRQAALLGEEFFVRIYRVLWAYSEDFSRLESFASSIDGGTAGLLDFIRLDDHWMFFRPVFMKHAGLDGMDHDRKANNLLWKFQKNRPMALEDFKSPPDKELMRGGFFYRQGEVEAEVELTAAGSRLVVEARSNRVGNSYGALVITLDGRPVNAVYVADDYFRSYATLIETEPGPHRLGIRYVNDTTAGGDRNVWIRKVTLQEWKPQ